MIRLAECSHRKFYATFETWRVDKDFADPIFNYLVHGWDPGSFFSAVMANDFRRAVQTSHPANTVTAMKALVGWMGDNMPIKAWGDYEKVREWQLTPPEVRREHLEFRNLIYTEKEETWQILKEHA